MNYTKDIFDSKTLSQNVINKLRLKLDHLDPFGEKIYNLFEMAKAQNITKLNDNQITVAYYRAYTTKDENDIKTLPQVKAKLRSMISKERTYKLTHPNYEGKSLRRIDNEKDWYTVD